MNIEYTTKHIITVDTIGLGYLLTGILIGIVVAYRFEKVLKFL